MSINWLIDAPSDKRLDKRSAASGFMFGSERLHKEPEPLLLTSVSTAARGHRHWHRQNQPANGMKCFMDSAALLVTSPPETKSRLFLVAVFVSVLIRELRSEGLWLSELQQTQTLSVLRLELCLTGRFGPTGTVLSLTCCCQTAAAGLDCRYGKAELYGPQLFYTTCINQNTGLIPHLHSVKPNWVHLVLDTQSESRTHTCCVVVVWSLVVSSVCQLVLVLAVCVSSHLSGFTCSCWREHYMRSHPFHTLTHPHEYFHTLIQVLWVLWNRVMWQSHSAVT